MPMTGAISESATLGRVGSALAHAGRSSSCSTISDVAQPRSRSTSEPQSVTRNWNTSSFIRVSKTSAALATSRSARRSPASARISISRRWSTSPRAAVAGRAARRLPDRLPPAASISSPASVAHLEATVRSALSDILGNDATDRAMVAIGGGLGCFHDGAVDTVTDGVGERDRDVDEANAAEPGFVLG